MPLMIFIGWAIQVYSYVILARVILDWLMMTRGSWRFSAVRNLLWAVTEPVLSPIRRLLDPYQRRSRLDFSPLILIVLLHVLARALMRVPM